MIEGPINSSSLRMPMIMWNKDWMSSKRLHLWKFNLLREAFGKLPLNSSVCSFSYICLPFLSRYFVRNPKSINVTDISYVLLKVIITLSTFRSLYTKPALWTISKQFRIYWATSNVSWTSSSPSNSYIYSSRL